jgi:transposase
VLIAKLHELIAALPLRTVAMQACSGAHHWARLFTALGQSVCSSFRSASHAARFDNPSRSSTMKTNTA